MNFTIEELSMNAWPSIQTILLDGWIIRMANGYTKRANSVNPLYLFNNNLDEKIKYCENIYRKNNLPTVYKIIGCDEYEKIDQKLEQLNYEKVDVISVQICNDIAQKHYKPNKIDVTTQFTDEWRNCFYHCSKIDNTKTIETIELMLKNIKGDIIAVHKKEEEYIGCGYGIIEKDFIGIFDIIIREEYRRKGHGKEIVKTILAKAEEIGVGKAYLQVVNNNTIAKELYKKLGFKEIYKCWYRKKD
jgi:RimJ/RimL family protein N-acetyltransferase